MTITTTLINLVHAAPALTRLMSITHPQRAVYYAAKLGKLAQAELKHFDEQREALLKKYGARPATPEEVERLGSTVYTIETPEKQEQWANEMKELGEVSVTLNCAQLKFSDLKDHALSAADLMVLEPFVAMDTTDFD